MESGGTYTGSSSLHISSPNIWRNNNAMEIFVSSSRAEDDEEAFESVTLERPPTYSHIRRGMLTNTEGQAREIDIRALVLPARKDLLNRLVKIAEKDNEKFLLKLKDRIDR